MTPERRRDLLWLLALLALAAAVRLPGVFSRAIWYDEAISLAETSGHRFPDWPRQPVPAGELRALFDDTSTFAVLVRDLRETDVHPPFYFAGLLAWRQLFGPSIEAARAFSLAASLASVAVLFLLLRKHSGGRAGLLLYVLATGAAHGGHEARAYALAELCLVVAVYLGCRALEAASPGAAAGLALGASLGAGAAFQSNYFASFPAAALVLWLGWRLGRRSGGLAAAALLPAALVAALALPTAVSQSMSRTGQFSGETTAGRELAQTLTLGAQVLGVTATGQREDPPAWQEGLEGLAFAGLLAGGLLFAGRRRSPPWTPLALLASAPLLGVFAVSVLFDQHLDAPRYTVLAAAGLAVLAGAALDAWQPGGRRWGRWLLAAVLLLQASRVNWGFERCVRDQTGSGHRSLAAVMAGYDSPSRLVLLSAGAGTGDPSVNVYEIAAVNADCPVLVYGGGTDLDAVVAAARPFADLWVVFASDRTASRLERDLVQRLRSSGADLEVFRSPVAIHLLRVALSGSVDG